MKTLELRGNTLGVDATVPIAESLEGRPELRHALWSDLFTGRLKAEIPKTLVFLIFNFFFEKHVLEITDISSDVLWCSFS